MDALARSGQSPTRATRILRLGIVMALAAAPLWVAAADRGMLAISAAALFVVDVVLDTFRSHRIGRRLLAFRYAIFAPTVLFLVASAGAKGDAVLLATAWAILGLFALSSVRVAMPLLAAAGLLALTPRTLEVPREEVLRVATYNVEGEAAPTSKILQTARSLDADVICLQEVGVKTDGVQAPVLLSSLEKPLRMRGVSVIDYWDDGNGMGNAILSRWPIDDVRTLELPFVKGTPCPRVIIRARVNVRGRSITVVSAHLDRPPYALPSDNAGQMRPLLDWIRGEDPLVLGGDFNAFPFYGSHALAREELVEARDRQRWPTGSWPNPLGLVRIDWMFARGLTPITQRIVRSGASDHFPVVADFRLPDP